ncbi:MAG: coproporphyrinogen III oxidase family protein [Chloroflexi bacterium]|nr:coproporphyrinogen III oxidase family protein [Chloroflexota bacterium]MDL1883970.1 radical SAM family heme chaperone HemW [Anaerolineae bacterium CFX8]
MLGNCCSWVVMVDTPYSIYLHIPFCRIKCTYCAFNTYIGLDNLIEPFVAALCREIEILGMSKPGQPVGTVYLGGGTPSVLRPDQIGRILAAVRGVFDLSPDAEISMEANPGDLDPPYMMAIREQGINRVSIGMQSSNNNELELFGRRHNNDAVARSVAVTRQAGFNNLNLDLIYGFPHQTLDSWENSLRQMLRLEPEHVSLYALGLEDGTAMKAWVTRGYLPAPDDDLAADMYELASDLLDGAGYEQYEISNWAKPGYACRHNLQYWRNLPYPGLGPGAHGYADGIRYSTILSPHKYIQAMQRANGVFKFPLTPAADQSVRVDREAEITDTLLMGLRLTQEGINRAAFRERFGVDLPDLYPSLIEKYCGYGLMQVTEDRVCLTRQGRFLSSVVFREFV